MRTGLPMVDLRIIGECDSRLPYPAGRPTRRRRPGRGPSSSRLRRRRTKRSVWPRSRYCRSAASISTATICHCRPTRSLPASSRTSWRARIPAFAVPPITISCSHEHVGWPGTVSISARTLHRVVTDIAASLAASGVHRLVLANGHGGNYTLGNIAQETSTHGPLWQSPATQGVGSCSDPGPDGDRRSRGHARRRAGDIDPPGDPPTPRPSWRRNRGLDCRRRSGSAAVSQHGQGGATGASLER